MQEIATNVLPGGLFIHWDVIRDLIGVFHSVTGRIHQKYEYRWFPNREVAALHNTELAADEAAATVTLKSAPPQLGSATQLLKPAPLGWLLPMFEPMD